MASVIPRVREKTLKRLVNKISKLSLKNTIIAKEFKIVFGFAGVKYWIYAISICYVSSHWKLTL